MVDQWETCEIMVETAETDGRRTVCFWAKANGPDGPYNAGESDEFVCTLPVKADRQAQTELQALIRRLIDEGWDIGVCIRCGFIKTCHDSICRGCREQL